MHKKREARLGAATYTVTNLNDDTNAGSLRWAITNATDGDTIAFDSGLSGTITLASELPEIKLNSAITISGGENVTLVHTGNSGITTLPVNEGATLSGDLAFDVQAETTGDLAYGIYDSDDLTVSTLSGSVSATADGSYAFGFRGGGDLTVTDLSGSFSATAGDEIALGLYSSGAMTVTDLSGSVSAAAGTTVASGLRSNGALTVTDLSGSVSATAVSDTAHGLYASNSDLIVDQLSLSGSVSATADSKAYGFYSSGGNITVGQLSGSVSATADADEAYGLYTGLGGAVTVTNLSGSVSATAGTEEAYGLYTNSGELNVNSLSGTVSATAGTTNARGLHSGGAMFVETLTGSVSATANTYSYGLHTNSGDLNVTDLSRDGSVSAYAKDEHAYGLYTNSGDLNVTTLSGTVSAKADDDYAYGLYANSGDLTVTTLIGTVSAYAKDDYAYGLYTNSGTMTITGLSGLVSAWAVDDYAYGLYTNTGDLNLTTLSGTVSATTDFQHAYGLYTEDADLNVTTLSGLVSATANQGYAYGLYAKDGGLSVTTLSGTVSAWSDGPGAYGLYTGSGDLTVDTLSLSGSILADSQSGVALGLYSAGDLTVNTLYGSVSANAHAHEAYGFEAGGDITLNTLAGTVSAHTGTSVSFGIHSPHGAITVGQLSGDVLVTADTTNAYGMSSSHSMTITDLSGLVSATTGTDNAYGLLSADGMTITDLSGTVSAIAQNGRNAYGLHTSFGDITVNTLSGSVSAYAKSGRDAYGINSNNDLTMTELSRSGSVSAYASTNHAKGLFSGDSLTITDLSGSVSATAGTNYAYGLHSFDDIIVDTLSGTVSATAGGYTALGLHSEDTLGSGSGGATEISGTVTAQANGLAVAVSALKGMNIYVTGTLSATDTSGSGKAYAIAAGTLNSADGSKWGAGGYYADTVTLGNGASVTGNIDLGWGTNLLTLDGAGTYTGDISYITTLTKTGSGIWSTTGSISTADLTVSKGTLQVNISQTATPTVRATGTVTNNSTVLFSLNTPIAAGTTFTALTSGGLTGTGTYTSTPFLTAAVNANNVDLTKNSFTDVFNGTDETWEQVAEALDDNYGTATGDLADLISAIEKSSTQAEAESAMDQITSPLLGQGMDLTLGAARLQSLFTQSRMAERRTYLAYQDRKALDRDDPESWPLIAAIGDLSGMLGRSPEDNPQSLYMRTVGRTGSMDSHGGQSGYDHRTYILSGGYDHVLGDSLLAGINAGYGTTQADYDDQGGSRSAMDSHALGVYGSWFQDHWYVDVVLAAIYNRYDLHRELPVLDATAKAEPDGHTLSAKTEGGYRFETGNWGLTPRASLEYTRFHQDGYTETGAGAANLVMGDTDANFLESGLGLTVDRTWETGWGMVIPELSAMWLHPWLARDRAITYAMTGLPGTVFSDTLAEASEDTLRLGAGVRLLLDEKNLILTARYQGDLEEHARSHSLLAEVQFVF